MDVTSGDAAARLEPNDNQGVMAAGPKYGRIFPVEAGPALFVFACANPSCRDGGHDLTSSVLRGLSEGKTEFSLDQHCEGNVRTANCERSLHVDVTATYRARSQ